MPMTEAQLNLARALVDNPKWMWVDGMALTHSDGRQYVGRISTQSSPHLYPGALPALHDYATAAILLRMAMETGPCAVKPPGMAPYPDCWVTGHGDPSPDLGTEAAKALLEAWHEPDTITVPPAIMADVEAYRRGPSKNPERSGVDRPEHGDTLADDLGAGGWRPASRVPAILWPGSGGGTPCCSWCRIGCDKIGDEWRLRPTCERLECQRERMNMDRLERGEPLASRVKLLKPTGTRSLGYRVDVDGRIWWHASFADGTTREEDSGIVAVMGGMTPRLTPPDWFKALLSEEAVIFSPARLTPTDPTK